MTTSTFTLTDSNGSNTIKNSSIDQWNRSIERALDEAAYTGELNLNGRKLREFPHSISSQTKCDLSDTVTAGQFRLWTHLQLIEQWESLDLSRNRFTEFPRILCSFFSLERLNLYHNAIKSIPDQIVQIHMLKILDLRLSSPSSISIFIDHSLIFSRNQLTFIPAPLCKLQNLEVLLLHNNKLVSLPEEIGQLKRLIELVRSPSFSLTGFSHRFSFFTGCQLQ